MPSAATVHSVVPRVSNDGATHMALRQDSTKRLPDTNPVTLWLVGSCTTFERIKPATQYLLTSEHHIQLEVPSSCEPSAKPRLPKIDLTQVWRTAIECVLLAHKLVQRSLLISSQIVERPGLHMPTLDLQVCSVHFASQ